MRFIYYSGSLLGWAFLIYFCWNQSIPWWFKKGVSESVKAVPEIAKTIPKDDWGKPKEEDKKEGEKQSEGNSESEQSDNSKKLFSGEIQVGKLRSKYNLDIQQDRQSESVGKQDMGAK